MGQRHADREQQRSAERWNMLANLPTQTYETYLGMKDRERAEEERQRAIDRQALLDERYADEQAQKARDRAWEVGMKQTELLQGQPEALIAQVTGGETARRVLAGEGEGTDAGILYTPDMPTEPVPEQVVTSRVMVDGEPISESTGLPTSRRQFSGADAWRGLPQAEPGASGQWVTNPVEGESDVFFPIETAEQRAFETARQNIADLAHERSLQEIETAGDIKVKKFEVANRPVNTLETAKVLENGETRHTIYDLDAMRRGEDGVLKEWTDMVPPTEEQEAVTKEQMDAAAYYHRHRLSNDELDEIVASWDTTDAGSAWANIIHNAKTDRLSFANYALASPEERRYLQAATDIITAQLRRESGAAISESEFDTARLTYLPMPGDTPDQLRAKRQRRLINMNRERAVGSRGVDLLEGMVAAELPEGPNQLTTHPLVGTTTTYNGVEYPITSVEKREDGVWGIFTARDKNGELIEIEQIIDDPGGKN